MNRAYGSKNHKTISDVYSQNIPALLHHQTTGQGTGLGLSLSYDIIKAHGGELKVETKEGEGAEFIIQLPVMTNN